MPHIFANPTNRRLERCTPSTRNFWSNAVELAPEKIRVNAIVPGLALTPGTINRPGHIDRGLKGLPMGEIVMPEEIAGIVAFALSGEAPHMTGTELKVDSGRTAA